jgi:hypothetical protein
VQIARAHQRRLLAHLAAIDAGVVLFDVEGEQQAVEVLHVADVAAEADEGLAVEGLEAVDVGEAGEAAVAGEVVGGDDDAGAVLEGEDGGAGDDGLLRVLLRLCVGGGQVGGVVGAVDVVAGL